MNKIIAVAALLTLTGCLATSGDLQRLADSQAELEAVLADRESSQEEVEEAMKEYGEEIAAVSEAVKNRGEGLLEQLSDPASWTPAGLLSMAMWWARNQSRRKELDGIRSQLPPSA